MIVGRVDSSFDSCFKDTGSNPIETNHYVTTVGKLFTPTVPSRTEGRLNQLIPGIAGYSFCSDSGQVVYLRRLRHTQPFILNCWINRVRVRAGDADSARWQITLCDLYGMQAPV